MAGATKTLVSQVSAAWAELTQGGSLPLIPSNQDHARLRVDSPHEAQGDFTKTQL